MAKKHWITDLVQKMLAAVGVAFIVYEVKEEFAQWRFQQEIQAERAARSAEREVARAEARARIDELLADYRARYAANKLMPLDFPGALFLEMREADIEELEEIGTSRVELDSFAHNDRVFYVKLRLEHLREPYDGSLLDSYRVLMRTLGDQVSYEEAETSPGEVRKLLRSAIIAASRALAQGSWEGDDTWRINFSAFEGLLGEAGLTLDELPVDPIVLYEHFARQR